MYAAAGGASLASRQARQRQRKQKQNTRLAQMKKGEEKSLTYGKHFQNYTEPKVKLSRVEINALKPPTQPELRRHSTSHLNKPEHSRSRIKQSPSILIPIHNTTTQPLTPCALVQEHPPLNHSPSIQSNLPQIFIPDDERRLERRCSFVRQVEEMDKCQESGLLDRCNHICNFKIEDPNWDNNMKYYSEFHRSAFGSIDYPFSEVPTCLLLLQSII